MIALLIFLLRLLMLPSNPKRRLEAENAALRQQLTIAQRKVRGRVRFTNSDRLFFVLLYRWFPSILTTVTIIQPETLVRWHRAGFRRYWRWKSRNLGGHPPTSAKLRVCLLKIPNRSKRIEISALAPYRRGHDLWRIRKSSQKWSGVGCPFRKSYPDVMVMQLLQSNFRHTQDPSIRGAMVGA